MDGGDAIYNARTVESNIAERPRLTGRLLYWWSLFAAAMLLLIFGPPAILISWAARRREWVYPWALWGGRQWLRLSGTKVRVRGKELLDPRATYVFLSNRPSYLATATLFCHLGGASAAAKKELLKSDPRLRHGHSLMAIDRSNRERAIKPCMRPPSASVGVSFGVFAEARRPPGASSPFKKGAFYMAIEAGVPIVPVAMKNTDRLMRQGNGRGRQAPSRWCCSAIETAGLSTDEDGWSD